MIVPDFKVRDKWITDTIKNSQRVKTISYVKWRGMIDRCKTPSRLLLRPTYKDCTVSENFKDFQYFTEWHRSQIGYGMNYDLDKDLLFPDNKIYSEHTCVLIPSDLNKFLLKRQNHRGEFPLGVSYDKVNNKYRSKVIWDGKYICLGRYTTADEAFNAYCKKKEALAKEWHKRLVQNRVLIDPRVLERLEKWTVTD